MSTDEQNVNQIPAGKLGIVCMNGCEGIGDRINSYLNVGRGTEGSYLIETLCPRFSTGEGKGMILESVRGYDIYILADVFNHGVTYKMYGRESHMSPDDHYQDLKRIIAALGGKTKRITVVMPMLYESRQHKRSSRESLDCAMALQELTSMGVENIITFDAHDARVQNAIPLNGFENAQPYYQMVKALVGAVPDISIDRKHLMMISPDEGAMSRGIYYSTVLELDLGMFYKMRDYSKIVDGRNPIISHEFLGDNINGKDVIIVDDIIASGESIIDVSTQLKSRGANRIFVFATYGLFVNGLDKFDEMYRDGVISKVFTTNLTYRDPGLLAREWYTEVDMSKYIALIIDTLNYDTSISGLLNPAEKIRKLLRNR